MSESKKTILVTGGAGFIGSHLCERLAKDGHRVISLDNYFTGTKENHVSGVEYREGHTKDIARHVPEKPDIIYHLGEYSRVEQSVLEPELVYDLNTLGTQGVIEYWQTKRSKLVYAGSSTKFGDGGATRHTSPYAKTKAENSEIVVRTGMNERLPYAVAYFYNVYGDRERTGVYGTVIEHFKRMYLSGAPCAVVSPGTQLRNFTHVGDIVDGLILVGEKGEGDEFGIGNEKAYSIIDVARMFGFTQDIVMFPERVGNRMSSSLDTAKTRALGWVSKRELTEYVRAFVDVHPRGERKEKHVIVFSTTMYPISGPAENAFISVAKSLPDVQFTVVAARYARSAPKRAKPLPNVSIETVGLGTPLDKFILPVLGALKARKIVRGCRPLFAWSLLASYSALAGTAYRALGGGSLLISLADQAFDDLSVLKRIALRLAISRSDQVYGTHAAQEKDLAALTKKKLPRNSLGEGDAFANAIRFAYSELVRRQKEGQA